MSKPEGFAPIPIWMLRDKSVSRRAILVYASLSSRSGLGAIYPSQTTIAEESGVSERTVRSALSELEDLGVVERRTRRAREGRSTGLTTAYVLHPNGRFEEPVEIAGRSEGPAKGPATSDEATGNDAHPLLYKADNQEAERGPRDRGSRLPEPFIVTAEMWAWVAEKCPLIDGRRSTEMFVNHFRAATGQVATKKDWPATWRNWLLRDQSDAERRAPRAQTFAQQKQDGNLALLERYRTTTTTEGQDDGQISGGSAAGIRALGAGPRGH